MKKVFLFLFGMIFLIGCGDDKVESELIEQTNKPKTTLSKQTEIKASVITSVTVNTPTIQCTMCEKNILKAFDRIDGITEVKVDLENKNAQINYNEAVITVSEIKSIISKTGYDADDIKRDPSAYDKLDECCKDDSHSHG